MISFRNSWKSPNFHWSSLHPLHTSQMHLQYPSFPFWFHRPDLCFIISSILIPQWHLVGNWLLFLLLPWLMGFLVVVPGWMELQAFVAAYRKLLTKLSIQWNSPVKLVFGQTKKCKRHRNHHIGCTWMVFRANSSVLFSDFVRNFLSHFCNWKAFLQRAPFPNEYHNLAMSGILPYRRSRILLGISNDLSRASPVPQIPWISFTGPAGNGHNCLITESWKTLQTLACGIRPRVSLKLCHNQSKCTCLSVLIARALPDDRIFRSFVAVWALVSSRLWCGQLPLVSSIMIFEGTWP